MPESFEQQPPAEDPAEKNKRMAAGNISQAEIEDYLRSPEGVLFEHTLVDKKEGEEVPIKVRYLTKEFMEATLENLKDSWDELSFENLKSTLEKHFEQKESGNPGLLNVEYYIATDANDRPIGMTGLYTVDIQGGAGFATKDKLDANHYFNMGLGWYSVSKDAQGIGLGKYLLDWTENLAKSRGANHLEIETDDWSNSKKALEMYKKSGYKLGYPVKNFFGPGRDLDVYYMNCEEAEKDKNAPETSEITEDNKEQVLEIAKANYSPERFEEFKVCLDLFLSQPKDSKVVYKGDSVVVQDEQGKAETFAIYSKGIYNNVVLVFWLGAGSANKDKLIQALKNVALRDEKYVIMVNSENEDRDLDKLGFTKSEHGVPGVFEKGDTTNFLLLTKSFK